MKTLDEVIADLECCNGGFLDDAIHYLKTYRENQQAYEDGNRKAEEARERYLEAVKNCEVAENKYKMARKESMDAFWRIAREETDNLPLTWDELNQMEGKPVWVEQFEEKRGKIDSAKWWMIAETIDDDYFCDTRWQFWKDDLGKTWQAYRKERG